MFTIVYPPDNKDSAEVNAIRDMLSKRGFEWDEDCSPIDEFGEPPETRLDTGFNYTSKFNLKDIEEVLSHITCVEGMWYYDGIERTEYNRLALEENIRKWQAGEYQDDPIDYSDVAGVKDPEFMKDWD